MGFQVIVHLWWVILMFAVRGVVVAKVSAAGHECRSTSCSHDGPEIRFPFWIKDKQPDHCGYPGFQVFCDTGKTLLHFEYLANTSLQRTQIIHPYNVSVLGINYATQEIQVDILITNNLKLVSTSTSLPPPLFRKIRHPYYDQNYDGPNTSFFNCSSRAQDSISVMLTSAGGETFPVDCLVDSYPTSFRILNCIKVFNSSLPFYLLEDIEEYYYIDWSIPDCRECEAKGEYCKLMDNITSRSNTTTCVPKGHRWTSIKPVAVIIPVAILIALSLVVLLYFIIKSYRQRKYDQLKIEMFLTNYKAMKPTRYTYADIKKITNNFSDKLGQGGYGSVYKGQITKDIIVAVKVLKCDPKANGEDFINEVGTLGRIYHVNVVRLLGYCADGCNRALVYEFQPNNSLEKFTYSGKNQQRDFLGLKKMQEIALGIAKGIGYLHQGCTQQILHFDIKPHNILLDQNFNPKISESDVYSFGMLLLEMVGARNNNAGEKSSETYFPEWIFHRLEEGGEITIEVEKEEDSNIAKKLTIVGLWCIGWHPVDRPSMKHAIHMLESEECPKMPPNPFKSSNIRSFENELEAIDESE